MPQQAGHVAAGGAAAAGDADRDCVRVDAVAAVQDGPAVRGAPTRSEFGAVEGVPGFPRGYQVQVSMDGATWSPVAEGQGTGAQTLIAFPPTRGKFVRITQTAAVDNAPPLSIRRLRLFVPGTLKRDSQP